MNPERLKQLRLAHGWSLDDLVKVMGGSVTKQSLSKYELGKSQPSPRVSELLAHAYSLKVAELWDSVDIDVVAYRKRAKMTQKERGRVESTLCELLRDRVYVQRLAMPDAKPAIQFHADQVQSLADAEAAANALRARWHLGEGPLANVVETLEDHLIHVIEMDASSDFDGVSAIARDSTQEPIAGAVVSRKSVTGERQRLSLAHELGHLVMASMGDAKQDEPLAMRFGATFLVPAQSLKQDVGTSRTVIGLAELLMLKSKWGMSIQALLYRMKDLEIISSGYFAQWFRDLGARDWRSKEPEALQYEKSSWLQLRTLRLLSEGAIAKENAERILGKRLEVELPTALLSKRNFINLPIDERRRLLAQQAAEASNL